MTSVVLGLLLFAPLPIEAASGKPVSFKERVLAVAPEGYEVKWAGFSPLGDDVAFTAERDGKLFYFWGKRKLGPYDELKGVHNAGFGPDGGAPGSLSAREGKSWRMIHAFKPGPEFDEVGGMYLRRPEGADARPVGFAFYKGRRGLKWHVVAGGKVSEPCDELGFDAYVTAGGKDAYWQCRQGARWLMFQNARKNFEVVEHAFPKFSPDGEHLAYAGIRGDRKFVVVDGAKGEEFSYVNHLEYTERGVEYDAATDGPGRAGYRVVGGKKYYRDDFHAYGPDGRLLAEVTGEYLRKRAVVRGQAGPAFTSLWRVAASPDGESVAYSASEKGWWGVVLNGRRLRGFDQVSDLLFGPDGQVYYKAKSGERWALVAGDSPGDWYDGVSDLTFSPKNVPVYKAKVGEKWAVVVGRRRGPLFVYAGNVGFLPDQETPVYLATDERGKRRVVVGTEPGEPFEHIDKAGWNPDGRIVYVGNRGGTVSKFGRVEGGKYHVVVDGEAGEGFDEIHQNPTFVPGGRVLYVGRRGEKYYASSGNGLHETERYPLRFSPDKKRWAYKMREGGKEFSVLDGVQSEAFDEVTPPYWVPGKDDWSYVGTTGGKNVLVAGDRRVELSGTLVGGPLCGPDKETLAYLVVKEKKYSVAAGGRRSEAFDQAGPPVFSPDGGKVAFGARDGREFSWKVMASR